MKKQVKDEPETNQSPEKESKPNKKIPDYVSQRRFWELLGSNPNSYCVECGGVCGNSNHDWGKRKF